ncbi:DUF3619 family protein [Massilia cavernae]|uniref:DUF3619 family protein n=1 Tax=Massilia cavernae TaxID=2320864 RepID=A0A418XFJ9_9BURK|nr:DUF3619 family protein [Massilia cavernae]RJG11240.1 DUF3619 family protein [Massilia cavernae]
MNTDDLNFAYKVRHALNEHLDHLPDATVDRLAQARKAAMARKKPHAAPLRVAQRAVAGNAASLFSFEWLGRMGVAVPLMVMIAGLAGIYQYQEEQRIAELAELDAGVLSDELPLTAYLDQGFNAYVDQRTE